ncbi:hypothetical protein H0H93_015561 [Arthromyces matolae]|nr:hypothetical protein H0H93_015561 [Arthromyces matolae]
MASLRSGVSKRKLSQRAILNHGGSHKMQSLPLLPTEIYLTIFSFATSVPQALDTSFEGIQREEKRVRLIGLMFDCMRMRANLSSVSKAFHSIMENLLYEIIVITHFETIPKILSLLQHIPPGRQKPRGHTCRRLDIHISIRLNQKSDYLDEAWDVGRNTLWGLLDHGACRNLEVLTARTVYTHHDAGNFIFLPHLGHNALCKTISTHCARTLRRLELSGFDITMDRIEMMLRRMSNLEACSISDCRPFNNIHNQYERRYRGAFCGPREYDENEEEEIFGIPSDYVWKSLSFGKFRKNTRLFKSTLFSDQRVKDFYDAREHAEWPPFRDSPPYELPKLHSFHLDNLTERVFEFKLPALKSLNADEVEHEHVLFNTNLVPDVQDPPTGTAESMSVGRQNERPSKYDLHPNYRHLANGPYHTNPIPHSTPFGIFPSTITHLTIATCHANLARTLYFFPNLTNLTWYIENKTGVFDDKTPYWKPNDKLKHITLRDYDWGTIFSEETKEVIGELLKDVKDGWLLNLSELVLGVRRRSPTFDNKELPFKKCKRLGIELAVMSIGELHDMHTAPDREDGYYLPRSTYFGF